jgi:hypothetical protein
MARPDAAALPLLVLKSRARRVYETARLQRAIVRAWPVPVAAFLGMRLGAENGHVLALASPLLLASIALVWVGRAYGRAVAPGLAAGIAPLVLPGLMMDCAEACAAPCQVWCQWSCMAGGILAGLVVGYRSARFEARSVSFSLVAAAIALTTGAIGCLLGGAPGVTGMLFGFALGAVPALVLVPKRVPS